MDESGVPANPRLRLTVPDPGDRNTPAAKRLTNAVICLLMERGAPLLADALKPEEVTKRAGKSRASYYRTDGFPASEANNHEARIAVLERAIAEALKESADDVATVVGGIAGYIENGWVSNSPREFIRTTAEQNFDDLNDHSLPLQLLAGALAPSSVPFEAALQDYYRRVTDAYAQSYSEVFRFWGYRPRPPLTTETFTIAVMALAEGLMLRYCGNGDIDRERYGDVIEFVGTFLLVADGDVSQDSVPPEHYLPGELPPPNRGSIIAALIRLFDNDRAALPTIDELARAAGCLVPTIQSQFGGVVGVIRAAWEEWTPEFDEAVERNRRLLRNPDPLTLLYRVANTIATRAAEQPVLTRSLLMSDVGVGGSNQDKPEPILRIFDRLLREASAAGQFQPPALQRETEGADRTGMFAVSLRSLLLTMVTSQPVPAGSTSEQHAQWCVDYVWALLMPARPPENRD